MEWTGLEFAKAQRAVENRGKWRKLVAKSSVVPERPSRLRRLNNDNNTNNNNEILIKREPLVYTGARRAVRKN